MSAGSSISACRTRRRALFCSSIGFDYERRLSRQSSSLFCSYLDNVPPASYIIRNRSVFTLNLLITSFLLATCRSTAQTMNPPVDSSNILPISRVQKQLSYSGQQPHRPQQVVAQQPDIQTQQRRSASMNSNLAPTNLPTTSLQSSAQETFAQTAWRGLAASMAPATYSAPVTPPEVTLHSTASTIQQQQQQPKTLKFTLIAGKYWKFNVKTNSLQSSHKEKELRLHRNVSLNNYIIDDDGWFQYNHQQQQLFAWPSLITAPSTYYFVLLPSGLDYEADGENVINNGDVVANIVVELLRPLFIGARGSTIDQYIDHKFTLEYLHRHQSYPLLLSQIVSLFETLAKNSTASSLSSNHHEVSANFTQSGPSSASSNSNIIEAIQLNKQTRLWRPLNEYLLINSSATSDGEFFSLTWTTHLSLINNTIAPTEDCRLPTINETISKLSSRSILYPTVEDKFVISYALEGPLASSNTIIPTERGNYALQLYLDGPCRRRKVIDELTLSSIPNIFIGFSQGDLDNQKENSVHEGQVNNDSVLPPSKDLSSYESIQKLTNESSTISWTNASSLNPSTASTFERDEEELSDYNVTAQYPKTINESPSNETSTPSTARSSAIAVSRQSITNGPETQTDIKSQSEPRSLTDSNKATYSNSTFDGLETIATESVQNSHPLSTISSVNVSSSTETASQIPPVAVSVSTPHVDLELDKQTPAPHPYTELPILVRHFSQQQQQPPKVQPTAKSFASFLDSQPDAASINFSTMPGQSVISQNLSNPMINPTSVSASTMPSIDFVTNTSSSVIPPITVSIPNASPQETSLNEDLIGIMNDVMDYLVSVAVPIAIIIGILLSLSIIFALYNLFVKKKKSKQFEIGDRFKFRYGSERRQFLKNSSKPVILEADQKSLSIGGTPQHRPLKSGSSGQSTKAEYQKMTPLRSNDIMRNDKHITTSFDNADDSSAHG